KEIKDTVMSWRSRIRHCVEKGEVYSLLIGSSKIGQGSRVGFDLYITPKSFTEKYFYHTEPEKMPSFNYTHGAKLSSELVAYNRFADTTIQIDNMKFSGLMHFREITIAESGYMRIQHVTVGGVKNAGGIYAFKGWMTENDADLDPYLNYAYLSSSLSLNEAGSKKYGNCFYMEKGRYTLVSIIKKEAINSYYSLGCEEFTSQVELF